MKNKKKLRILFFVFVLLIIFGSFSFAQAQPKGNQYFSPNALESKCGYGISNISDILCRIGFLLNEIIPVLLALGLVYFIWGIVTYVIGNDEEAKKKGKKRIIYGLIGFVVIFGLWGIVAIVLNQFGLDEQFPGSTTALTENFQSQGSLSCNLANSPKLGNLIDYITCIISRSVIPLIFVLAVAAFVWGVVQYVINSDSEEKRSKGRQFMIWGIVALTVMISIWGLVRILGDTFDINFTTPTLKQ